MTGMVDPRGHGGTAARSARACRSEIDLGHEALNFTPWLAENADRLAEALGIELEFEATEHAVGGYSLDIIGKDQSNGVVLTVENQLGESNHSHLGQLLTYAAGTGASTI